MVSVFSSKLKDPHTRNNCSLVLPTFEYLNLNKFCNLGPSTFIGSNEWYHNPASCNSVRQNIWTFTPLTKQCVFIQSFEQIRCASASSSGFPENFGLKFDQSKCKCCCCGWSFCFVVGLLFLLILLLLLSLVRCRYTLSSICHYYSFIACANF